MCDSRLRPGWSATLWFGDWGHGPQPGGEAALRVGGDSTGTAEVSFARQRRRRFVRAAAAARSERILWHKGSIMAEARIYDAAFDAGSAGHNHTDLGRFWWIDTTNNTGSWTRQAAHDYV